MEQKESSESTVIPSLKCPVWLVCESPSRSETWACNESQKERLLMCVIFLQFFRQEEFRLYQEEQQNRVFMRENELERRDILI